MILSYDNNYNNNNFTLNGSIEQKDKEMTRIKIINNKLMITFNLHSNNNNNNNNNNLT
jgi:hypothetical protein